jgi:hypothetical protein
MLPRQEVFDTYGRYLSKVGERKKKRRKVERQRSPVRFEALKSR